MHLFEDNRQKKGMHEEKHEYWQKVGCRVERMRLPFGDYIKAPLIAVDTKRDIYEIANNIQNDHTRFRNECVMARDWGCQLIILIENLDGVDSLAKLDLWMESDEHFYRRGGTKRIIGRHLAKAMQTMTKNYGVRWEFCTPNESGRRVHELLDGE